jgi:hypothetical protein
VPTRPQKKHRRSTEETQKSHRRDTEENTGRIDRKKYRKRRLRAPRRNAHQQQKSEFTVFPLCFFGVFPVG